MTATVSAAWLDEAIEELEREFPGAGDVEPPSPSWDNPPWNPTEVTIRIRDYVTQEFEEGKAGNRDSLPSTYDVAKACVRGSGNTKSCRRAMRHLHLLETMGEVIRIRDPGAPGEDGAPRRYCTFWALPDSGREVGASRIPVAVTVSALTQWQIDLIRDIDLAETAPNRRT